MNMDTQAQGDFRIFKSSYTELTMYEHLVVKVVGMNMVHTCRVFGASCVNICNERLKKE